MRKSAGGAAVALRFEESDGVTAEILLIGMWRCGVHRGGEGDGGSGWDVLEGMLVEGEG